MNVQNPRKGNALVMALVVLVGVIAATLALVAISVSYSSEGQNALNSQRALYAAEAGLERAMAALETADFATGEGMDDVEGTVDNLDYRVAVTNWATDGVDNNEDGNVDEGAESGWATLSSSAVSRRTTRTVLALVRSAGTGEIPDI